MRKETLQPDTCVYCGKPITEFPCKGMPDGKRAHLDCYIKHLDKEDPHTSTRSDSPDDKSCAPRVRSTSRAAIKLRDAPCSLRTPPASAPVVMESPREMR